MVCTFFGHRDAPYEIEHILRETVENLIKNENVKTVLCRQQREI